MLQNYIQSFYSPFASDSQYLRLIFFIAVDLSLLYKRDNGPNFTMAHDKLIQSFSLECRLCCEFGISPKQITNAPALLLSLLFMELNKYLTDQENKLVINSYQRVYRTHLNQAMWLRIIEKTHTHTQSIKPVVCSSVVTLHYALPSPSNGDVSFRVERM